MALRTVGVRLMAEVSDYQRKLRGAGMSTREFVGEMGKAAKSGHLDRVADRAAVAGLAIGGIATYAIKAAADFDKSMSKVKAATHASASDIEALRKAAIQAGKDTQYSATEAADGITELSKAGVGTADILGGGLKGALSLAAAGELSVSEAAETAASALTQFKLKGNQVPHVADLLAAAAGKAQGSVHDMGYALNQSGLVASQFGLSIEDTTGALAEFANAGLIGSDAGTSFKTMLLAMANPSKVTARKMQELGISFYDAQGKFIGLSGVAAELHDKLGNLTEEERNAALGQIYGNDAIRAATVLYKDGAKGVEEWKNKVNDAGYASTTAAALTDNLAGDIERLKGSLETMAIEAGGGANSGLRVLTKSANALVDQLGNLPPAFGSTLTVIAAASGAALLLGSGWVKLRRSTAEMFTELERIGPAGERTAAGLRRVTSAAGKAAAAFAALEVVGAIARNFQDDLNPQVDALSAGLTRYAQSGQVAGEASRVLGSDLDDLKHGFKFLADDDNNRRAAVKHLQEGLESLIPGLDGTNTSLARTKERITAVDGALAQMVTAGQSEQARKDFEALAKQLAVDGVSMDEFKKQFPAYAAAVEAAGAATDSTAGDVKRLAGAADSASGAVMALSKQIDELFQEQMTADRAALKLAQSTNDLAAELRSGSRTLSINTAEGRKNRAAVLDQLEAIEAVRDARVRGGATIEEATRLYQKDIDGLRKIMRQAGFTTKQIDDLTGAYKRIPAQVVTKVSAPGALKAKKDIDLAYTSANHFAGPYVARLMLTGDKAVDAKLADLLVKQRQLATGLSYAAARAAVQKDLDRNRQKGYATGGWTGPGAMYEPAGIVHRDEYVIRKDSRRKIEAAAPGLLDAMNTTGMLPEHLADATPGYAAGGRVWPFRTTVSRTKIPSLAEVLAAVTPAMPGGGGGPGYRWMEAVIRAAFPGLHVISDYRPGAMTLTGHRSYHGFGRAVDYPPSRPLAEWINAHYFARTKELITPWNDLNIHNGQRHRYTGAVWNQHNFAGGNAHDHWAMATGGTISEPIFGIGASGRTYSFGENYQPERVTPGWQGSGGAGGTTVNVTINSSIGTHPREVGRQVVDAIGAYLGGGGRVMVRGQQVLP